MFGPGSIMMGMVIVLLPLLVRDDEARVVDVRLLSNSLSIRSGSRVSGSGDRSSSESSIELIG